MASEPATAAEILDDEPREPAPCAVRLPMAVTDGTLCSERCEHLKRGSDECPICEAFCNAELHVSFEAEPLRRRGRSPLPRVERLAECLIAEDLFGARS